MTTQILALVWRLWVLLDGDDTTFNTRFEPVRDYRTVHAVNDVPAPKVSR